MQFSNRKLLTWIRLVIRIDVREKQRKAPTRYSFDMAAAETALLAKVGYSGPSGINYRLKQINSELDRFCEENDMVFFF